MVNLSLLIECSGGQPPKIRGFPSMEPPMPALFQRNERAGPPHSPPASQKPLLAHNLESIFEQPARNSKAAAQDARTFPGRDINGW